MPYHKVPAQYNGKQFGIQYLHKQSLPINYDDVDEEDEVDEGLGDESLIFPHLSTSKDFSTLTFVAENNETYFTDAFDKGLYTKSLRQSFILCH